MAFISLILTAQSLIKLKKALEEEKLESIKADEDAKVKKKFKFSHLGVDITEAFKNCFKKCFKCSDNAPCYKTCYKLGHEGSCENYTLKSVLGFFGGVFLTYFCYILFIFQLNVKLTSATWICSFLGCILTVGLAFSSRVRCVVLLTLPQFFSKRGRQAFLAYAFVLALTGPAQNTLNNLGILSESLACGQEQLKQAVRQIIDVIKKPFLAIKEAIKKVIKTIKEVIKKIKEILLKIKRVVMAIVRVIKSVFEFLGRIINICNKELGTPFERCTRVFENAIADCNAKLGPLFNWLCSLTYIVKAVCYLVKIFDYVCMIVDFISNSVVGVIIKKVKTFIRHIKTMFYVRIKFAHSFKFETVSSKSLKDIAKEIVKEIKDRSKGIVAFFNFMTSASMLFFLWLIFQVAYYRIKYMTSEKFDNIYITHYFREIDQRRAKVGKETVLPLTKKEKTVYVPISGGSLARSEKRSLKKAATTLATASVKLGVHMAADYSLYWILTLISKHAKYQSKVQAPNLPVAHITGEGFLAKLLRSIVNAFQPVGIQLEIDTVPCLPIPIPPDLDRYAQIGVTIVFCWILTLLEPYGLRLRNYIMGYYHPIRAKQRTIWLYNHILRCRTSFLLMARRNLRKKFGIKGGSDEIGCRDWLRAKLPCSVFKICLGETPLTCMLGGEIYREKNKKHFKKCHTPNCPGLFCLECFADLDNICPICLKPIDYGDIDDIDEEKDSSGDEAPKKKKRWCSCLPCCKPKDDDQESLIEQEDAEDEEEPEHKAHDSDTSTDYSYGYQYDDDHKEPPPAAPPWRDLEKQPIPDEASMESFREGEEEIEIAFDNLIRLPKGKAVLTELDVEVEEGFDEEEEEIVVDYGDKQDNQVQADIPYPTSSCICSASSNKDQDAEPLLSNICECSQTTSPRRVEFIGLPLNLDKFTKIKRITNQDLPEDCPCICSDLDNVEVLKSTMSTSTKSDCKYCKCDKYEVRSHVTIGSETEEELRGVVPPLDLSFLQKEDDKCKCDNPMLSSRFSYVTYQEISESSPKALNSSLESSSVISELQDLPSPSSEDSPSPVLRNRKLSRSSKFIVPDSPNSAERFELSKAQNKKVRQYYEATKSQTNQDVGYVVKEKRRSISDMFKNLLPKRKKDPEYLPLYERSIPEEIEIRSYNYNDENWDTFSQTTQSPTYPFATQRSQETSDEEQELLGRPRIRGGECKGKPAKRKSSTRGVKPFDAKSEFILGRTKLKDFTTLSLPPRPKPANSKELFNRYFGNVAGSIEVDERSMTSADPPRSAELNKQSEGAENSPVLGDAVDASVSSESNLSESVCKELFGENAPEGLCESISRKEIKAPEESVGPSNQEEVDSGEEEEAEQQEREGGEEEAEEGEPEETVEEKASGEVPTSKDSKLSGHLSSRSKESRGSLGSKGSTRLSESALPAKRQSTQHQLLYKDDKTEISLVQKLSPDKPRRTETAIPIRASPSVKVRIALNNAIIPEEGAANVVMKSPKSQDKLVETNETFPLDWRRSDGRNGKLVFSNDKNVQTSENNIYSRTETAKNMESRASNSTAAPLDLPERDSNCKRNNCNCSRCLKSQATSVPDSRYEPTTSHNELPCKNLCCDCSVCRSNNRPHSTQDDAGPYLSTSSGHHRMPCEASSSRYTEATLPPHSCHVASPCSCCQCNSSRVPAQQQLPMQDPYFYARNPFYNTPAFPPVTAPCYDMPDYLPPPPPPPPRTPLRRPPGRTRPTHSGRCSEQCRCGMAQNQGAYREEYDYNPANIDLPYQNNEDYLDLVNELQDTLHTRTSNRVKKAREAFENRSKQNKPLEKPVINYDETDESEEPIMRRIDQLRTDRKVCCARDKCACGKKNPSRRSGGGEKSPSWMMDPGSGEWQRGGKQSRRRRQEEQDNGCDCTCNCDYHR